MIGAYVLAIAALLQLDTVKPALIKPFASEEECVTAAQKRNSEDEDVKLPEAREKGLQYVCYRLVLPQ
jgi:hypothetical protein